MAAYLRHKGLRQVKVSDSCDVIYSMVGKGYLFFKDSFTSFMNVHVPKNVSVILWGVRFVKCVH